MRNIKLLVCGSRTIMDTSYVFNCIEEIINQLELIGNEVTHIIEGQAKGVDSIAGQYAKLTKITLLDDFKPDWDKKGMISGLVRNKEMVDLCDKGVAIWDGKSTGTAHSISLLRKQNKLIRVFNYKK